MEATGVSPGNRPPGGGISCVLHGHGQPCSPAHQRPSEGGSGQEDRAGEVKLWDGCVGVNTLYQRFCGMMTLYQVQNVVVKIQAGK